MRVLMNFMCRDGWWVHCIAEDCRTPLSPYVRVASKETLRRLIAFAGGGEAGVAEFDSDARRWARGGIWLDLTEGGARLLRVDRPRLTLVADRDPRRM